MATMYYLFLTCGSLYLRVFFHTEEVFTLLLLLLLLLSLKLNQGSEFNMRSIHSLQASQLRPASCPWLQRTAELGGDQPQGVSVQVIYFVTMFIVFIQCLFECFTGICCPRPEVMGQVHFFLKALNFKGRKKSKKDPCSLRSEGPLTCERKAGFSCSGTPPARKPTPQWRVCFHLSHSWRFHYYPSACGSLPSKL